MDINRYLTLYFVLKLYNATISSGHCGNLNYDDIRMIGFGLILGQINHCKLINTNYCSYGSIKYICFCMVGFYGMSLIVGYLIPNTLYTHILDIWFVLVWFYGISTIVGYLMLNKVYVYLVNTYELFCLRFMVYQLL